jgi:hypothetical protein
MNSLKSGLKPDQKFYKLKDPTTNVTTYISNMARSNEILGWEGVGNRQLLCFFKA